LRDRIEIVDAGVTAIGPHHGIEDAQGRAFSGSVPAQQGGYTAVPGGKAQRVERADLAE